MKMQKGVKPKGIIYQKVLLQIITSSMGKTFITNQFSKQYLLASYEEAGVKLTNTQINKLEPAKELNTGTKLR